ncbi:MAG: haloacid dehalogenase-like hydrolase [Streptococcaceae bacterium]|nr:haloacid dehalogenase-like hydrolase [Streptococcaceae bacterium]MCH4176132.1 haloacid dehalogenase-like hydrolase [Streptococcaceae bacterium]
MVQRLISATSSEIKNMTKEELFQSIKASEGRVILSENVVIHPSVAGDITCAEMSRAYGADMILLNAFDVNHPIVVAAYEGQYSAETCIPNSNIINRLKELVGLPIGMNVEPVAEKLNLESTRVSIAPGRKASIETFTKANDLGLDFILLTGNPGTGVTNDLIAKNVAIAKKYFDGLIIAGKMHSSGVDEPVVSIQSAEQFLLAGADIVLVPAVGTVWGISDSQVKEVVDLVHSKGKLVMSAIGTSQESSQPEVIQNIGIRNKVLGIDIQHIGDANMGLVGIENIKELSDAIRGKRHTVARMARSINR